MNGEAPFKVRREVTALHRRCQLGNCVSAFELDNGNIAIIGKEPGPEIAEELAKKIGPDERLIILDREFLRDLDL